MRDRQFILIYPPSKQPVVDAILAPFRWSYRRAYRQDLAWLTPQLKSAQLTAPATWLNYNGYVYAAWDSDQAGKYGLANRYLTEAADLGESAALIDWIRADMATGVEGAYR